MIKKLENLNNVKNALILGAPLHIMNSQDLDSSLYFVSAIVHDGIKNLIQYEFGTELGVSALIVNAFLESKNINPPSFFDEIDWGNIENESNLFNLNINNIENIVIASAFLNCIDSSLIFEILGILNNVCSIFVLDSNDIKIPSLESKQILDKLNSLPENNGAIAYLDSSLNESKIMASSQFLLASRVKPESSVNLTLTSLESKQNIKSDEIFKIELDSALRGVIARVPANLAKNNAYPFWLANLITRETK